MPRARVAIVLLLTCGGCGQGDDQTITIGGPVSPAPPVPDLGPPDGGDLGARPDLARPHDLAAHDLKTSPTDLARHDLSGPSSDLAGTSSDLSATPLDLATAPLDLAAPPDLAVPPPASGAPLPVPIPRTNINASLAAGAQTGADVAIDPTNTPYFNHLLAASDDAATDQVSVYETNDGATSWRTHKLLPPLGAFTGPTRTPAVAYDSQGNGLISTFAFDQSGVSAIAVARRPVGAGAFLRPVIVPNSAGDRQRIAVDRAAASPRKDTVYLVWSDGGRVQVAASSDGGASFGAAVQVNDDGSALTNPSLTPAADGTVYVTWLDAGRGQLRVDRSLDGGATWGPDHVIHQLGASGASVATPAAPQRGARLAPFCDVDRSTGVRSGTLFCVFHDVTPGNGLDVFLRRSSDGGATWSAPQRINDDPAGIAADQFLPRVQIDETNGKVAVAWYDTRDDPAHVRTQVYFTRANDGSTFAPSVRVSTASTDESRAGADPSGYGESIGIEAFLGRVRVLWTDARTGDEDVFSCIIDFAHFAFFLPGSSTITVPPGGAAPLSVTVQPVGPFTASVQLSLTNLPSGATQTWSTNPVAENGSSTVTVTAAGVMPGSYTIGLHGQGGGEYDTRDLTLVVQ
jgi:hypothetical protein